MSLTQATLRGMLRESLLDTLAPQLWTDDVLHQCLDDAVTTHSFLFPFPTTCFYDVAAGDRVFTLGPLTAPGMLVPIPTADADLIAVQGVELPVGTPVPEDPWQTTDPASSSSSRYRQGYRWRAATLSLRNPAAGAEVGTGTLRVDILQTYNRPNDVSGAEWNGPNHDVSLIILLAKRAAYQFLAEWQARDQGITPALAPAGSGANLHLDIPPILAALEVQITRAIALRQQRNLRSRALDI